LVSWSKSVEIVGRIVLTTRRSRLTITNGKLKASLGPAAGTETETDR
jgi:hypothetical protein